MLEVNSYVDFTENAQGMAHKLCRKYGINAEIKEIQKLGKLETQYYIVTTPHLSFPLYCKENEVTLSLSQRAIEPPPEALAELMALDELRSYWG